MRQTEVRLRVISPIGVLLSRGLCVSQGGQVVSSRGEDVVDNELATIFVEASRSSCFDEVAASVALADRFVSPQRVLSMHGHAGRIRWSLLKCHPSRR